MGSRSPTLLLVLGAAVALASCVLAPYRAQGKACDAEHGCPDGLACVSGVCGECSNAADCGAGQICAQGLCGACGSADPCPAGESCSAEGVCEAVCGSSLQSLVAAAPAGAVVVVPACTYREQLALSRPVTLAGRPGAEVRGSDVWTSWTPSGSVFVGAVVPALAPFGTCASGQARCRWPEQVFFDGRPLRQVASSPAKGEFALNADRSLVLADDPNGHLVEVSVRRRWITTRSDGVTLRGLTFRHAAAGADGALSNDGASQWTLERSRLMDSHGPLVWVDRGSRVVIQDNVLQRAGQVIASVSGAAELTLARNSMSGGNTEAFDPEGVAGGISISGSTRVVVRENEVFDNAARGIACVQDCADVTFEANRVHHNVAQGIWYGASERGVVSRNAVWESGWGGDSVWGFGGGVVVWCASDVEVSGNLVAWNPDGITAISQTVSNPRWLVRNVFVHDNTVLTTGDPRETTQWILSLGWVEDWQGSIFAPTSGNHGANNRFWSDRAENANQYRFNWDSPLAIPYLVDFVKTPGGVGSTYLSLDEKAQVLTDAGVPLAPEPH